MLLMFPKGVNGVFSGPVICSAVKGKQFLFIRKKSVGSDYLVVKIIRELNRKVSCYLFIHNNRFERIEFIK